MRRLFGYAVAVSVGFWLNETLRLVYDHTLHAPARQPARGPLPDVIPITNRRNRS